MPASMKPAPIFDGDRVDRLEARAAEAVDREAGDVLGPLRRDQRDARDARALLLDLRDAADDDVLDEVLVELLALGHVVQRLREQLLRVDVRRGRPCRPCRGRAAYEVRRR